MNEIHIASEPQPLASETWLQRCAWKLGAASVPLLSLLGYLSVRRLESLLTFNPKRCGVDQTWELPEGVEEVWIKGPQSSRLHGWFVWAPHQLASATVLYCHGKKGNLRDVSWIAEYLAVCGLNVLIFDYRGYGRSEGKVIDEHGLYADGDAAYDYLINKRNVSPNQLVIYGHSLGTTVAIDIAARRQCAALIVESGLSSAEEMGGFVLPWAPKLLFRLGRNRFDSTRKLARVQCPVLIAHGTHDFTIPVEQSYALYNAAPEPKKLILVAGAAHHLPAHCGNDYLDSVAKFIAEAVRPIAS